MISPSCRWWILVTTGCLVVVAKKTFNVKESTEEQRIG